MIPPKLSHVKSFIARGSEPRWTGSVAQWCADNLRFNEPKLSGPFSFHGREYMREPLDTWSDNSIKDQIGCWGTRTGKTRIIFGGLAWRIKHNPTRALWVMPNAQGTGGAQAVSRTRFQPMIRSSPCLAELIPTGARRHDFKALQMLLGGSIIDLTGSNSPANLAGHPCDTVVQDEVDKYMRRGESEAEPSRLADQRAKEFSNPKRLKWSTPTLESGIIWQEFLKTDQRRRFMPCPHCGRFVVLPWSRDFTVFPILSDEAFVRWDDEAKRKDGTWDLDRVVKSARAECPHCKGHIRDEHKILMDQKGEWRPTAKGAPGYRGYHLPSMYSVSAETGFGQMAKRFLLAKHSLQGLQDFVNSDLAEPWCNQDSRSERIELISPPEAAPVVGAIPIMTVDYQQLSPHFWYVVRAWTREKSRLLEFGNLDTWQEVAKKQEELKVRDNHVGVDSGKFAEEVYECCLRHGKILPIGNRPAIHVGWLPMKGFGRRQNWREKESGLLMPFFLSSAPLPHRKFRLPLLEFAAHTVKDMISRMRKKKTAHLYEFDRRAATEEYFRHMDGEVRKKVFDATLQRLVERWVIRSRSWPNHGLDCESMNIAMALFHKLLPWNDTTNNEPTKETTEPDHAVGSGQSVGHK